MSKAHLVLVFLGLSAFRSFASPSDDAVVARVNGKAVLQSDLIREIDRARTEGRWVHDENREQKALDQAVLQRLAADRALKDGLEKDPKVAKEIEQVLARHYLDVRLQKSGNTLTVSDADVNAAYQKQPLLKLRHIAILARTAEEKKEALNRMRKVQKLLAGGERFQDLANSYSEDPAALPGGELDSRGVHNLPAAIYDSAVKLSVGRISPVIELDGTYHLVQLVEKKPLKEAPTAYLELLRSRVRSQRKEAFLSTVYADLKPSAKIEILPEAVSALSKTNPIPLIPEEKNR